MPQPPVPVHIITGFLGAGKTTTLLRLLHSRPAGSRWAVLVNEFGQVGLDGPLLSQDSGVVVRQLVGGCLCCTTSLPVDAAIAQLIRSYQPQRILIEASGAAHAAGLIDKLRHSALAPSIWLAPMVAIVSLRQWQDYELALMERYQEQLAAADIWVPTYTDTEPAEVLDELLESAAEYYPAKAVLSPQALEDWFGRAAAGLVPAVTMTAEDAETETTEPLLPPTAPHHQLKHKAGLWSYSAAWPAALVFDLEQVVALLQPLALRHRLKCILHTSGGWVAVNAMQQAVQLEFTPYRMASRLELVAWVPDDELKTLQARLDACVLNAGDVNIFPEEEKTKPG